MGDCLQLTLDFESKTWGGGLNGHVGMPTGQFTNNCSEAIILNISLDSLSPVAAA
jgi:hypothetical protein